MLTFQEDLLEVVDSLSICCPAYHCPPVKLTGLIGGGGICEGCFDVRKNGSLNQRRWRYI